MSNVEILVSKLMWLCHCAHSVESNTGKRAEDYKITLYNECEYNYKVVGFEVQEIILISPSWSYNIYKCPVQGLNGFANHHLAQAMETTD